MSGYLAFSGTGCAPIDRVLKELNDAGDRYHHTQDWNDDDYGDSSNCALIQKAANEGADEISRLRAELSEALAALKQITKLSHGGKTSDTCPRCIAQNLLAKRKNSTHTNDVLRELETWLRYEAALYRRRAEQAYSEYVGGREHLVAESITLTKYADSLSALLRERDARLSIRQITPKDAEVRPLPSVPVE